MNKIFILSLLLIIGGMAKAQVLDTSIIKKPEYKDSCTTFHHRMAICYFIKREHKHHKKN